MSERETASSKISTVAKQKQVSDLLLRVGTQPHFDFPSSLSLSLTPLRLYMYIAAAASRFSYSFFFIFFFTSTLLSSELNTKPAAVSKGIILFDFFYFPAPVVKGV